MQRRSNSRMSFKCPLTYSRPFIVPAGALYAQISDVGIEGNATFTNNSAADDGGTTRIGLRIACNPVLVTTFAVYKG